MKKTFKKVTSVLLVMLIMVSSLAFTASAYVEDGNGVVRFTDAETLELLTYTVADGEVTITDCTAYSDYHEFEFEVPETIEGYPVTAVAANAFSNCRGMIKCTLPYTVQTIGDYAFGEAYELKEVVANGIVEIGARAFWGTEIEEVVLPATLEKIAPDTFKHCEYIKSFAVSYDNEHFFTRNGVLFNIDKTVLLAFPGLSDATGDTYTVPETVTEIADFAFSNCKNNTVLKTIVLTNVKTIGEDAFAYCPAATVTLNDGVESIGEYAFYGSAIEAMVLPSSVKTIGREAFRSCESLKSVNIPEGVTRLEDYMFDVDRLDELYLPSTLTYLGVESAPGVANVYYNGTQEDWRKLGEYEKSSSFDMLEIFFNDGTSHKHDFAWRTIVRPTCLETGYEEYGCPDCDIVYETRELAAYGHVPDNSWILLQPQTTTSEGLMGKPCVSCGIIIETKTLQKLGACVYNIMYNKSHDTHNTFTMYVTGRATMVQFIEPDGGTRTYDRSNKNVTIKSYTYYGGEVSDLSRELNYEVWTVNTNLTPNVEIKVRAKYVQGDGYAWDNAMNTFTVELAEKVPNAELIGAEPLNGYSGKKGPVETKVVTGPDAEGVRFVMPDGSTATYSADKATVLEDGNLEFVGKAWANDIGENEITVQIKKNRVWYTVTQFTYNAS